MQKLYYPPGPYSPEICFSHDERIFFIRGISSPADVRRTYYPVIDWLRTYIDSLLAGNSNHYSNTVPLKFQVDLEYFNSSSAKFLYDILLELKRLVPTRIPMIIEWIYDEEDTDMQEAGSDIAMLLEMEFTYQSKPR